MHLLRMNSLPMIWLACSTTFLVALLATGTARAIDAESILSDLDIKADIEIVHESRETGSATEITFDEVGLELKRYGWEAEAAIKYDSEDDDLLIEEAALQLGLTDEVPWFIRIGRTTLPFVEVESRFIEDPLTSLVGETIDDAIVVGVEGEDAELAIGAFPSEFDSDSEFDFVASLRTDAFEDLALGVSVTTDLGESVELRELHQDYEKSHDLPGIRGAKAEVRGLAGFFVYDIGRYLLQADYVSALKSYPDRILADDEIRPSAWNLEAAYRPAKRWELAARLEGASDLPEYPDWQLGIGSSYSLSDQVRVAGEYLRGQFEDEPDRDLLGFVVSLRF